MTTPIKSSVEHSFSLVEFIKSIPSRIRQLAQKTWQAVSHLFSSCYNSVGTSLTNRDIRWLQNIRRETRTIHQIGKIEPIIPQGQVPAAPTIDVSENESNEVEIPANEPNRPYIQFDPALEELRSFARDIASLSVDEAFKLNIAPKVDSLQNMAPSLPPVIKSLAKLFVEMGDKAAKPLYQKFAAQKEEMIDPTVRKLFKTLMKPDLLLLKEELTNYVTDILSIDHPHINDEETDIVEKIVNWIALPELQRPPVSSLVASDSTIDPTILEQLTEKAQTFWNAKHQSEKTKLFNDLLSQIKEEFKDAAVPFMHRLDRDYIEPILTWLLLSDQTKPLSSSLIHANRSQEDLIDKLFERTISLLVEKKIDHFAQLLERTIQSRLGEITQDMLKINAERIADYFSERIAALIDAASYTEMFDQIVQKDLRSHIQGVIVSERNAKLWKDRLDKSKQLALSEAKKPADIELKEAALIYLTEVEQHGSEELYLEHKRLEAYSQLPFCSQPMKELINQTIELTLQGKDPAQFQRANEKAIYESFAERLLDLMMPTKKVLNTENEIVDSDPFTELWDLLYFPNEFNELIRYSEELTSEFITPDTMALLGHLKEPMIEIAKNLFKSTAKDHLRKHIGTFVKKTIETVIQPESLNAITAQSILPTLNKKLIITYAKQEITRNPKIFLPFVTEMSAAAPEQKEEQKQLLFTALMKHMIGTFNHFDPENFASVDNPDDSSQILQKGLEAHDWMQLLLPVVNEIDVAMNAGTPPAASTPKEMKTKFDKLFTNQPVENNPKIGNLIMDLIFRVGDMKSEWVVDWFVKDHISGASTTMLEPWRVSHEELITTMTSALRSKFLATDEIKRILAGEQDQPVTHPNAKLAHQIDVTSRLAHDMIMGIALEKGTVANFAVKKLMGSDSDFLNGQISMIYKRVLGNRLENENLILRCFESLFSALGTASETVRLRDNIKIQQLAAEK